MLQKTKVVLSTSQHNPMWSWRSACDPAVRRKTSLWQRLEHPDLAEQHTVGSMAEGQDIHQSCATHLQL